MILDGHISYLSTQAIIRLFILYTFPSHGYLIHRTSLLLLYSYSFFHRFATLSVADVDAFIHQYFSCLTDRSKNQFISPSLCYQRTWFIVVIFVLLLLYHFDSFPTNNLYHQHFYYSFFRVVIATSSTPPFLSCCLSIGKTKSSPLCCDH